jgi:phosphotransferase system HPr (HPr) family protein
VAEIRVQVQTPTGLHSRPADLFVRTAKLYESRITVFKGDRSANGKNIIKVILLNVRPGEEITIDAEGPDETVALEDLRTLVESDFEAVNPAVQV